MNTFRQLVAGERPLVLPGAHDAISARLIQRAGFKAYFIGGFPLVGARYGVPDIGSMGLGEIEAGIRDIMAASDLPVLVDCDNGYGDVKTVVRTINTYERLGAQAVFFEDQISPKRCGHIQGKRLLSMEQMEANTRAAAENRINPDTFIIARTDARQVYDLDEALCGERYIRAGADGLFIEAPVNIDELEKIGRAFDVPQLANMLEGGRTPVLTPAELEQIGFRIPRLLEPVSSLPQPRPRWWLAPQTTDDHRRLSFLVANSFFANTKGSHLWSSVVEAHCRVSH
jgi:2-methylisocitrate lyase-like PEP mutase family enzyme